MTTKYKVGDTFKLDLVGEVIEVRPYEAEVALAYKVRFPLFYVWLSEAVLASGTLVVPPYVPEAGDVVECGIGDLAELGWIDEVTQNAPDLPVMVKVRNGITSTWHYLTEVRFVARPGVTQ